MSPDLYQGSNKVGGMNQGNNRGANPNRTGRGKPLASGF